MPKPSKPQHGVFVFCGSLFSVYFMVWGPPPPPHTHTEMSVEFLVTRPTLSNESAADSDKFVG
jgi:hypothetical protein